MCRTCPRPWTLSTTANTRTITGIPASSTFSSFYNDFLSWTGQPFLSPLKQIEMATSKGGKLRQDPATIRPLNVHGKTCPNSDEAGKAASLVRDLFRDLTAYAKDTELQSRLLTVLKRALICRYGQQKGERTVTNGDQMQLKGFNFNERASLKSSLFVKCPVTIDRVIGTGHHHHTSLRTEDDGKRRRWHYALPYCSGCRNGQF